MNRLLLPLLALAACASPTVPPAGSCVGCHGQGASSAPPFALGGLQGNDVRGVGAHQTHLQGGQRLGKQIACEECHLVPEALGSPGHIDDGWPAEVVFGPLATTGGITPAWDPGTLTCSGSWCHGSQLGGGPATSPVWTRQGQPALACDGCHGFPPPAPHPQESVCGDCHAATVTGTIITTPENHLNGVVNTQGPGPVDCSECHGADGNPAPPPDLGGSTDPSSPGVGAHAAHLAGGAVGAAVACETCHPVPAALDDGSHLDGTTDVVFSGIAGNGGVTPAYDPAAATCTVYCHGAGLQAAALPVWTAVDGAATACGACHALPPPPPHPSSPNCQGCHGTAGPGPSIADPAGHVDGGVDF